MTLAASVRGPASARPSFHRRPSPVLLCALALASALGCSSSGQRARSSSPGTCKVELWSVSWDAPSGEALDEDTLSKSPLSSRYQLEDCAYAGEIRGWMNQAT